MRRIKKYSFCNLFEKLGQEIRENPDYKKLCPNPMDLNDVQSKLNNHIYHNHNEWAKDMFLIYDNAIAYNGEKSAFGGFAIFFKRKVEKFNKNLENLNQRNLEQNLFDAFQELKILLENPPVPEIPEVKLNPCPQTDPFTVQKIGNLMDKLNIAAQTKKDELLEILKKHNFNHMKQEGNLLNIDLGFAGRNLLLELERFVK